MEFMEPIPTYSIAKLAKVPTDSMEKLEKLPRLFENFVCKFYSRLAPHHEGAGVQPFDLPPVLLMGSIWGQRVRTRTNTPTFA